MFVTSAIQENSYTFNVFKEAVYKFYKFPETMKFKIWKIDKLLQKILI
jgi:hypothetical protein